MQPKRFAGFQRGLTLIEICVVLAIVSILVGTAMPSFEKTKQKLALDGTAAEMSTDLRYVRSEAVARNEGVRISFRSVAAGTCTIIHTGGATDCHCAADGTAQCSSGAALLKSTLHRAGDGVVVAANVASMRFDPINGTVTPTGTICNVGTDGKAVHVVVNMMGRVRTCVPTARFSPCAPC